MTLSPKSNDRQTDLSRKSANTLLVTTIADTTWRMFVPPIGCTFIGIWLDHVFNSIPWFTTSAIVIGFSASILLVVLQLRKLRKNK
jgi:F0F1-type ATP synthase assembly protein I